MRIKIATRRRCELVDITGKVREAVRSSGVRSGVAVIYCPHTTAGITINENADPDVASDIVMKTSRMVEKDDPAYAHSEGNSDAHIKSSLIGASETVIIEDGEILLGTWQGIYFTEFDGPRSREFYLKILPG